MKIHKHFAALVSVPTRWLVAMGAVLVILAVISVALRRTPTKWNVALLHMHRSQVHRLLGVPDADFLAKGWDAWDRPVILGAWVLTVTYDETEHVAAVRKHMDWGLGYL